jgi:hypothetical protein
MALGIFWVINLTKMTNLIINQIGHIINVATLALGLRPRKGVARLRAKRKTRESHHMLPWVPKRVKEWTLTLLSELPCWELESQMDSQIFIAQLHRSKTHYLEAFFISLKKRSRLKPLKVKNWPYFLACRQCATYHSKDFSKGYNFALDLIAIEGLHVKLCAPKVMGVPIVRILRLPLGSLGTKSHLDVAPMERCRVYYKGEGGGFPQVWAVVSLVCLNCSWFVLAPKVLQLCTKHFVLVLCGSV